MIDRWYYPSFRFMSLRWFRLQAALRAERDA